MNTYDRHLLREWLSILGLVLCGTVGLLFVQVLYDDFRMLTELGAGAGEFVLYFLVTMPSFLTIVLPLALLISLLFVLGKLHRANEFVALRAAGVGLLRITAPVWLVGVAACGLSWYLNASVVPWSVERSRSLRETLEFRHQEKVLPADRIGAVNSVTFDNRADRRMWFFNRYSKFQQRGYGATVSELDAARRETRRIVASAAWPDQARGGWMFRNGREMVFDAERMELLQSEPFAEKWMPGYNEDPRLMLLIDRRPADLTFLELNRLIGYYTVQRNPKIVAYEVRYFGLIANTLGPLIVIAIAVPFAVAGVRVSPTVGVSKSIGLFLLYYLLTNISSSLAAKQLVDPLLAAWIPNLGMAALAGWFFFRLR